MDPVKNGKVSEAMDVTLYTKRFRCHDTNALRVHYPYFDKLNELTNDNVCNNIKKTPSLWEKRI